MKHTMQGVQLLRYLAKEGLKIFSSEQAKEAARRINMKPAYVTESLYHLLKAKWITRLKRGVYALSDESGFTNPPHEFEIAMALVTPCAISHWTAMHYHHLTQQTPIQIFAITPTSTSIPRSISGGMYHFVKIQERFYFGVEKYWIGESQVLITDPERTLLDGLISPQYCGDFQEVLHGFKMRGTRLNLEKIIRYALHLDQAIVKRLGWILEKLGFTDQELKQLLELQIRGYRKLNPSGKSRGVYNKKWMIQENL